jgi:hypothetical protein
MKTFKSFLSTFFALGLMLSLFSGCENKDPSILKVFVRSSSNALVAGAKVVIVADVSSNPPTMAYVDTLYTNFSGFVTFDMDDFFTVAGPETSTGYFDILAEKNNKLGEGYIRCRKHLTAVETVFLMN